MSAPVGSASPAEFDVPRGAIIAMDGPSGTGKSTVARLLAERLGAHYLDTGAMYRAATVFVQQRGIDPADAAAVAEATRDLPLRVGTEFGEEIVELDGVDVSAEIRTDKVTGDVSAVSAVPELRTQLVALQHELAERAGNDKGAIVVEGRDIGTVVFPDAAVKIYLTASAEARGERRHKQNLERGLPSEQEQVIAAIRRRDDLDSTRKVSPLRAADDAIVVDTSEYSIDETLDELERVVATTSAARGLPIANRKQDQ